MTDMRATERLLEVIAISADAYAENKNPGHITDIQTSITELRRRGDTLVRREDLRMVMRIVALAEKHIGPAAQSERDAFDRLENAIGGKA